MSGLPLALGRARPAKRSKAKPKRKARHALSTEYNLLLTATLCLLAFGAVMVFSASSTTQVLENGGLGNSAFYLKRTLMFGAVGLVIMHLTARYGLDKIRQLSPVLLAGSIFMLVVVLGAGQSVNGASRWIGSGSFQIQPSELAKVALILYAADMLARKPKRARSIEGFMPILLVTAAAALLIMLEPDMGTTMVVVFSVAATLIAAGARPRDLGKIALAIGVLALLMTIVEPYRMARLTGFLNPGSATEGAGFQAAQAHLRRWHRQRRPEGLLPARGPHRHDFRGDRRGAGDGRHLRRRRPLRAVRLRRPQNRPEGQGQLRQAAGRRADLDDPHNGDDQPLRGDGSGAADRRAAALRLIRQQQSAVLSVRGRADPQRRPRRHRQGRARRDALARWQTARRRRWPPGRHWKESIEQCQTRGQEWWWQRGEPRVTWCPPWRSPTSLGAAVPASAGWGRASGSRLSWCRRRDMRSTS